MNPQETQQVTARDEKWVPSAKRVNISSTNIRLETIVPQKEDTFQVVIDIIKNSTCFKAFTRSINVIEMFMQQFWYTIKKVQDTDSYEFLLANKKCTVNAEDLRKILNICPRVEGEDFIDVPDDDTTLTFLIDLGYKGLLDRHTNIFVDHMHQPWRTLTAIINKCLSRKTVSNEKLRKSRIDILLKFFRISKDYQEYGHLIPDVTLTEEIKRLESYQMFIKYSTDQIPPKKSKERTFGKRRVKKKVTLSADDNIIYDDPDAALELAKSISQTKAEEAEAARKVHATHARIVTESVPKSAKKKYSGRSSKSTVIQDTSSALKSKLATSKTKLKGVLDEDKDITEEKFILEWGDEEDSEFSDDNNDDVEKDDKDNDADDEGDDHISDTQDADDEYVETKSDEDEIYKYKIRVHNEEDVEMKDAEVEESDKGFGDQFLKISSDSSLVSTFNDFTYTYVSSLMDIPIQHKTPQAQSLSVQKILVSVILETTNLPPIPKIVTETPVSTTAPSPQVTPLISSVKQTPIPIPTQPITIDAPTITTTISESNAPSVVELRGVKSKEDVSELKTIDNSSEALAILQSHVPIIVDSYLDTKVRDVFQKELQKHMTNLIHKYSLQHLPKLTKKPTPTAEQESKESMTQLKTIRESMMMMKTLQLDQNQGKKTKRKRTKESESSNKPSSTKETPKGKAPTKGSKTGKSASTTEPVEETIAEMVMDDAGDDTSLIGTIQKDIVNRLIYPSLFLYKVPRSSNHCCRLLCNNDLENLKTSDPEICFFLRFNTHLDGNVIVDFIVALRMFTRSLILKRRVEDLQLGVESYQKRLNIIKPHKTFPNIEIKIPYSLSYDPPGIIYEDLNKQKRVLRAVELYKFSGSTLKFVRDEIHHIVLDFRLDYNPKMPKRKWTAVDRKRSGLMIELIDKQLREREIIRNLE
uniref:Uncharacterized protein n=1 Tax=Tanacetum cinerariifolium TaxID=118510 RepID=A0A699GXH6_TANCI|nr:hypothetical protein [Tanacetum cinerariifolium]